MSTATVETVSVTLPFNLREMLPFVAKTAGRYSYTGVHVCRVGGCIAVEATDGKQAMRVTVFDEPDQIGPAFDIVIEADALKACKLGKRDHTTLTGAGEEWAISGSVTKATWPVRVMAEGTVFAPIASVIPADHGRGESPDNTTLNPSFLAAGCEFMALLADAQGFDFDTRPPVQVQIGGTKPTRVTWSHGGVKAVYVVMPKAIAK